MKDPSVLAQSWSHLSVPIKYSSVSVTSTTVIVSQCQAPKCELHYYSSTLPLNIILYGTLLTGTAGTITSQPVSLVAGTLK